MPTLSAACLMVVPFATRTAIPSMVAFTISPAALL